MLISDYGKQLSYYGTTPINSVKVPASIQAIKPLASYRKPDNMKKRGSIMEENKLQEIQAVQKFFEKYKKNSDKNKDMKETAFTKFIDKCESFGIPPRPFGIIQRKGKRQDIDVK